MDEIFKNDVEHGKYDFSAGPYFCGALYDDEKLNNLNGTRKYCGCAVNKIIFF